jgi:hypothetical protein
MNQPILLRETATIADLANNAISAIQGGEVDPIVAHINLSRMEAAIKRVKDNADVRDITLRELAKYGKKQSFGDCTLEEAEVGVKYDYSMCGDSELAELEAMKKDIDIRIKERQAFLKHIPISGIADPHTGEVVYPPARSSTTSIKTTFKKS